MDKYINDSKEDGGVDVQKYLNAVNADEEDKHWIEEEDEVDIEQTKQNDDVPKDEGWAWFVLLGATLEMFLQLGIVKSAGIMFVAFQDKFDSTSSVTSLLSTVQSICQSLTAFLVMTFGIKLTTYRNLLFFGSSLSCVAYIITSQATDIRVLLFSHGVLQGIGVGTALPATVTMVSLYFEKRRGFANSIAVSGGPVGGAVFASLITHLLATYGYQGCVLLVAAILLNGCVSGALFTSPSFYTDRKAKIKLREDENIVHEEKQTFLSNYKLERHNDIEIVITRKGKLATDEESILGSNYLNEDITKSKKRDVSNESSERAFYAIDINVSMESIAKEIKGEGSRNELTSQGLSKNFNFQLLTNPMFLAFLVQGSCIASGTLVAPIFLVPYARDINVSTENIATLVTTQSCIDLFARLLIGYISDKKWLRRSTIVATAAMIVAVSSSLLRFYTSFSLLLGYSVVLGLVSGVYFSLYTVVLIDYLTLDNFQTCLGFMSLVHGFSIAGVFYLVGYLRDVSGSYIVPHQVIGATTCLGAIIMFLMPVIERLQR